MQATPGQIRYNATNGFHYLVGGSVVRLSRLELGEMVIAYGIDEMRRACRTAKEAWEASVQSIR